jgi:biopolymer transport protein ExbD
MRERGWEIAIGNVELRIETDGSVDLDNVHIIDMTRLQSALTALASEKPIPKLHLQVDHDKVLRFENVGAIILIVQKAGLKIGMTGYLTEPAN